MTTVHRLATEMREMWHSNSKTMAPIACRRGRGSSGLWRRPLDPAKIALPFMQDLNEVTHENVQLAVRDGYDALYVERIRGPRSAPIPTSPGGRLPLHATGVGKALVAYAPLTSSRRSSHAA